MMISTPSNALQRTASILAVLAAITAAPGGAQQLGPFDGADLAPTDTGRVKAGKRAPDFSFESFAGPTVRLSQFRGKKNVALGSRIRPCMSSTERGRCAGKSPK